MIDRRNAFGQAVGEALPGWTPRQWPPRTPIIGRHCRLEPLDLLRHADGLHKAYASAPDARDWTYLPDEFEPDLDTFRIGIAARAASTDPLHMAVVRGNEPCGSAALMRIDPGNGVIEIGHVHFALSLRRTPAATEALFLLMRRAFDELGYRRLEWKCDSYNVPSRHAALRLGFVFEGIFRHAIVTKGRSRDTAWYAILASDWPGISADLEQWLALTNFDRGGRQIATLSKIRDGGV